MFLIKINKNQAGYLSQGTIFLLTFLMIIALGNFLLLKIFNEERGVKATGEKIETDLKDEISSMMISFSSPMRKETVEKGLAINPSVVAKAKWNNNQQVEIFPKEAMIPETEYTIRVAGAKTKWLGLKKNFQLKIATPLMPEVISVWPENEAKNVEYQTPIMIKFNQPIGKNYSLTVGIEPAIDFSYALNQKRMELEVIPTGNWEKGKLHKVIVKLKHNIFSDVQKELWVGEFTTKPLPPIVYNFDKNGQALKTEERKEEYSPTIITGRYIQIDLSSQTLLIFEDGQEVGAYKISTGKRGMNTPQGTFKILSKRVKPWSNKYKLFMPWFLGFTNSGHGIHELPEWPGGYKEGANHLGIPVSHGCVRLGVGPAKKVYDFVKVGTPVVVGW